MSVTNCKSIYSCNKLALDATLLAVAQVAVALLRLRQISRYTLLLALIIFAIAQVSAQNKSELESKRKKLSTEIKQINKELGRTAKNRQATYDHYVTLQSQIKKREELITTINTEVVALDDIVLRNTTVIASLSRDIADRQEEYGRLMRSALRFKTLTNPLLYILSAQSLNQAYQRWVFLRKYDQYRRQQSEAISFTRSMLTRKTLQIEDLKREKTMLIGEETENKTAIGQEMIEQNQSLTVLKNDEQRLKNDLEDKKRAALALDNALDDIIREEVRKAAEARAERDRRAKEKREKQKAEAAKDKASAESASEQKKRERDEARAKVEEPRITAEDALSREFLNKKGKLSWPVNSGFVARPFGNVSHPIYKEIRIQNNGIDIRTDTDAAVEAIHAGEVVGVTFVPGHDYSVIVQHGSFYSVYANLAQAYVAKGDKITQGQSLGRVSMNPISGASELHFEIWQNKDRLDPERWIGK
jgi:murein hydrolase activator